MALEYDIINMLLPVMIIAFPAFLTYEMIGGKVAFVGGAVIGMAIGTQVGLLDSWVIVLGIMALGTTLFFESGGREYVEEAL